MVYVHMCVCACAYCACVYVCMCMFVGIIKEEVSSDEFLEPPILPLDKAVRPLTLCTHVTGKDHTTCAHTNIHTCTHTHTHTYTHTHTHTHTHNLTTVGGNNYSNHTNTMDSIILSPIALRSSFLLFRMENLNLALLLPERSSR